jgi:hypothetical protein
MNMEYRLAICFRSAGNAFVACLLTNMFFVSDLLADSSTAKTAELAAIKTICRELVGSQFPYNGLQWQRPWQRLLPYLANKNDIYDGGFVCSGHCSGSVELRDGLWIDYTFPNPQKFGERWNASDGIIDSVKLISGEKVILHYEKSPK